MSHKQRIKERKNTHHVGACVIIGKKTVAGDGDVEKKTQVVTNLGRKKVHVTEW